MPIGGSLSDLEVSPSRDGERQVSQTVGMLLSDTHTAVAGPPLVLDEVLRDCARWFEGLQEYNVTNSLPPCH